jgi:ribosomal protein L31E
MNFKQNNKIIYIVARGHSGTTILDIILGNSEDAFSCGELISGISRINPICSCGEELKKCIFWGDIHQKISKVMNWERFCRIFSSQKKLRSIKYFVSRHKREEMVGYNNLLHNAIFQESGKKIIIDSSKNIFRGLFLYLFHNNTNLIHLIRKPEDIVESNYYRISKGQPFRFYGKTYTNKKLFPIYFLLNIFFWILENIVIKIMSLAFRKNQIISIKYEDLINKPINVLDRIEKKLAIDFSKSKEKIAKNEFLKIDHMIAGNGIRQNSHILFKKKPRIKHLP